MEKTLSRTTIPKVKAGLEVREHSDELSEAELARVSGGYIGETEKNISRGTRVDTASAATARLRT
jgi:hypothetical protein